MKTITCPVEQALDVRITNCVTGEFAVVGFDADNNVIDGNILFKGKRQGETVKITTMEYCPLADRERPHDRHYIINEMRVVMIDGKWWWILDVEWDRYGVQKEVFDKAWHWLGQDVQECIKPHLHDLLSDQSTSLIEVMHTILGQLAKDHIDRKQALVQIATIAAIMYSYEA